MTKVQGEFTRSEMGGVSGRLATADLMLQQSRDVLTRRRATAEKGEAKAEARMIARVFLEADLVSVIEDLGVLTRSSARPRPPSRGAGAAAEV